MLNTQHLRVRVKGSTISPSFIDPNQKGMIQRGEELLGIFKQAHDLGWTRGELEAEIEAQASISRNHKLLRGLSKVLFDQCTFSIESPLPPRELRQMVFASAHESGPIASERGPFGRTVAADIFALVAEKTGIAPEKIASCMYADLRQEQRLAKCAVPQTRWLLDRYNVALVQALLLRALSLQIHLQAPSPPRLRQLFRYIKFHQLIYSAQRDGKNLTLNLDGPTSLFRQSTKYGLQLANFFPALLLQQIPWTLTATLLWTKARHKKTLDLSDLNGLCSHYRDTGASLTREQQWFIERFEAKEQPWKLSTHTSPIDLGGQTIILPDFSFERDGSHAHLEIIGFWRKDYLQRRVELLAQHGPGNLILAVSKNLRTTTDQLADFTGEIIEFTNIVPIKRVLESLEAIHHKSSVSR